MKIYADDIFLLYDVIIGQPLERQVTLNVVEDYNRRSFHLRECKKFLAKVFNGCPYMIKCIVNNQKSVMDSVCTPYIYGRILTVMPVDALTECAAYLSCVYYSRHICITIIELD